MIYFWPDFRSRGCTVLDFGIRTEPEFGVFMMEHFGCTVHGFDPSPISQAKEWMDEYGLVGNPNYTFHSYGVGAVDGTVQLFDYDWGQVSIHRAHDRVDPANSLKLLPEPKMKAHQVEVATLAGILSALHLDKEGDVDVLKIDVEGSEWGFFQAVFDAKDPARRCPPAKLLLIEWHHHSLNELYGASDELNEMTTFLEVRTSACCVVRC